MEVNKLLTIKEAAQILGVTPLTLRNWDRSGKLVAVRHPLNNYRVYRRDDIEKLVEIISSHKLELRPSQVVTPGLHENNELEPETPTSDKRKLEVKHLD